MTILISIVPSLLLCNYVSSGDKASLPINIRDPPHDVYLEIICIALLSFFFIWLIFLNKGVFQFLVRRILYHSCSGELYVGVLIFHLHTAQYVGGIKGRSREPSIILTPFMS